MAISKKHKKLRSRLWNSETLDRKECVELLDLDFDKDWALSSELLNSMVGDHKNFESLLTEGNTIIESLLNSFHVGHGNASISKLIKMNNKAQFRDPSIVENIENRYNDWLVFRKNLIEI